MKQTIILHGSPESGEFYDPAVPTPSNNHWLPWLQRQLALRDELAQTPELPRPFDPSYTEWVAVFEQFSVSEETALIGHSCGAGFLVRYLSEHPEIRVAKTILVAPWLDPEKSFTDKGFFDFTIDSGLTARTQLHVFYSPDDDENVIASCERIKEALPQAVYHEYADRGHFCDKEFPELLELV